MRNRIGPLQTRVVVFGQTEQKETDNEPGNEHIARHGRLVAGDADGTVTDGNHTENPCDFRNAISSELARHNAIICFCKYLASLARFASVGSARNAFKSLFILFSHSPLNCGMDERYTTKSVCASTLCKKIV